MTVHVVGAGLAGLAASVRLASQGLRVTLYESAPLAGGRCRSYHDTTLGRVIDNGNHLMLSGNRSLFDYLRSIGAEDSLVGPNDARFPFTDLRTNERWTVRIMGGRWSAILRDPTRHIPGARLVSRLRGLKLAFARESATVAGCLGDTGAVWERFWDPLATAVLNTPPEKASARLLLATLRESFAEGSRSCRPLIARDSLATSLIDPALAVLTRHRADLYFGQRLRLVELGRRADGLQFAGLHVAVEPEDQVILALPPSQVTDLLQGLATPQEAHAIVNAHFLLPEPVRRMIDAPMLGLVGGEAQWVFLRDEVGSVTVSAADALAERAADEIAARLWTDVSKALEQPADTLPPYRVIKEKRATFSQTPSALAMRPSTKTRWPNLHLAGDWTDTGLPATIEGAVRSGHLAADAVLEARAR